MNRSPLLVIFLTVFIDLVGFGIVIPVLPLYAEGSIFHASPRAIGLLLGSYSIMQLFFTPILGRMSDKYGRRPVLFMSIIGTGLGFLILGFARTLWMLFLGRILDGITGGNISVAQAYIADVTTENNRAQGMGIIGAAFGLGFIFGPAIGGALSQFGVNVPLLFAAGLCFANATLLYFVLPETVTADHPARVSAAEGRKWSDIARQLAQPRLRTVALIYFLFILAFSIMTGVFSLYTLYRFNFDAERNGYMFAFIGIIVALVQGLLIGRISRRFNESTLIVYGLLMMVIALAAFPIISPYFGGVVALLVIAALLAVGNSLATPTLSSLASRSVSARDQGGVLGVIQAVGSLARALGPTLGGLLIYSAMGRKRMSDISVYVTFWTAA
ncbi:MAG: MFS transporter, partial [Pyrinomonadaceae bacterium]